jgi:hypothetical protein
MVLRERRILREGRNDTTGRILREGRNDIKGKKEGRKEGRILRKE